MAALARPQQVVRSVFMGEKSGFFDEMRRVDDSARQPYAEYCAWLNSVKVGDLQKKSREAEKFFRRTGITFNVYGGKEADERLIPFDLVPRIIDGREWRLLARGIEQRVKAINAFLHDI